MADMSLLRPEKRARQELSLPAGLKATVEEASTEKRSIVSRACSPGLKPRNSHWPALFDLLKSLADVQKEVVLCLEERLRSLNPLACRYEELPRLRKENAWICEQLVRLHKAVAWACGQFALSSEKTADDYIILSHEYFARYHESFALSYKVRAEINCSHPESLSFSDLKTSISSFPSKIQSNLESLQQLVGLDLQNCLRQILLLSATDVFETLVLRLNHYLEEWKKPRGLRSDPSIPSSYSDMVYKLHKSQLSPWFIEAMDYVESEFLGDLVERGYGSANELKGRLRRDLTAYLTKAKGEGGRNDVAHPFSTTVKQYWDKSSGASGKVRRLSDKTVDGLTQSQKDYNLQILDLLSNSQNIPECYRDLAEVAFPLQIFFLRDVYKKSEVKVEIVGGQ